jgi:hypothetical protein
MATIPQRYLAPVVMHLSSPALLQSHTAITDALLLTSPGRWLAEEPLRCSAHAAPWF